MTYQTYDATSMGSTKTLYENDPDNHQINPLYNTDGSMKDLNDEDGSGGGSDNWGNGYTAETHAQMISAYMSAQATITAAQIEAQATAYAAETNAEGAVNAAYAQADATKYASDNDLKGIQAQCSSDLEIAKIEQETEFAKLEVEKESVEVDKMNAQANQTTANASIISANADQTEADAKYKKAENSTTSESVF